MALILNKHHLYLAGQAAAHSVSCVCSRGLLLSCTGLLLLTNAGRHGLCSSVDVLSVKSLYDLLYPVTDNSLVG